MLVVNGRVVGAISVSQALQLAANGASFSQQAATSLFTASVEQYGNQLGVEQASSGPSDNDGAGSRPDLDRIRNSPSVAKADQEAWRESNPGMAPDKRFEHGFWVKQEPDGTIDTGDIVKGDSSHQIPGKIIGYPPAGALVWYHTHPNPVYESDPTTHELMKWNTGPSPADRFFSQTFNVPLIIRAPDGYHYYGPPVGSPITGGVGQ